MFNIGFPELVLIFIVALIVLGPGKMPELGRSVGKALGEFRRATDGLKSQLNEAMTPVKEVKSTVEEASAPIREARSVMTDPKGYAADKVKETLLGTPAEKRPEQVSAQGSVSEQSTELTSAPHQQPAGASTDKQMLRDGASSETQANPAMKNDEKDGENR
ncbi:twin-arginine translocase subunit TatB [Heliobacterium undosum]|uniref:Sec-independent protein translocase protein TatB homolog n=1 Tax=Heliomicrobium undosum TaxID=121734 RepID=A0A845L3E9_9FIRM|nr:Sec-independent protein translocase protein TatB [Heliomicrobium undosum]MZP29374.1 twin-arginine translocase subunit TatB [Heliomicrobium undosum]